MLQFPNLAHSRVSSPLKYSVVTGPAVEPVTYAELADWLRLPTVDDRAVVVALETAGRMYVEQVTRYTLITTTFALHLDWFPEAIILPARPVQAVTSITYIDPSGTTQTLDPSRYLLDAQGPRPIVIPPLGSFFPVPKVQQPNAVTVTFTAGFGDSPAQVPEPYKLAIKIWVATNYNQREAVVMGRTPAIVPHTFDHLLRLSSLPEV
jgi:uncharacterized phiE125 gp8 family phage protein